MMRPETVFHEAWRNVQSGASKASWLALALILAIALTSSTEVLTVSALDRQARDYYASGASIRVLKTEGTVDPQRCEALAKTTGVQSAGALKAASPIHISSLPGITTPSFETTIGLQAVLGLDTTLDQGVLISEPLAKRWRVRSGESVETDRGPMNIAAVFPYSDSDGRDSRLANAVLIPTLGEGSFDECWADVWPSTAAFDSLLRGSQLAVTRENVAIVSTLNPTLGLVFTGADEYQNRLTRYAPLASGALGLVISLLGGRRRRLEYASSRHAGVARADLTLIALVESAIWAGVSSSIATALVLVMARFAAPNVADPLYCQLVIIGAAGFLGATTGGLLAAASSRESRLFTYFKERN
ncbi:hypothetical protein ACIPWF_08150 [Paenarthrobacter sp. NPDC089989]|uniref:hypothetical protein n=1 Tax=unclassified Paenarthrobacter TaxID=2634190 RepID=UPI003814B84D